MALPTINLNTLTDDEVATLNQLVGAEIARRQRVARAETDAAAITATYLADTGKSSGAAWQQPTGAHNAYPAGWQVTHNGKTWESLVAANVWTPGVANWREVTTGTTPPAWVQPVGAQDAYPKGAKVTYQGSTYESLIDGNVWSPTAYPAGWKKL